MDLCSLQERPASAAILPQLLEQANSAAAAQTLLKRQKMTKARKRTSCETVLTRFALAAEDRLARELWAVPSGPCSEQSAAGSHLRGSSRKL